MEKDLLKLLPLNCIGIVLIMIGTLLREVGTDTVIISWVLEGIGAVLVLIYCCWFGAVIGKYRRK